MASAAAPTNVADTLASLQASLESATSAVPSVDSISPPDNGISLLDAKNEIFLSYLQSLALRNLEVIRSVQKYIPGQDAAEIASSSSQTLQNEIVENLVKQRVYLEKGVRPLEDRLKYTIDKTLRAAEEQDRKATQAQPTKAPSGKVSGRTGSTSDDESGSDSDSDSSVDEENALALGPNAAAMMSSRRPEADKTQSRSREEGNKTGVYRPPKITATAMPERIPREARKDRPARSRTLDEYVSAEMADAPTAQPSIGANIADGGRRQVSARERAVEQERRDYEETHFTRLQESKKDKAKRKARSSGFGGEEWRDLGQGLDRIDSLTRGVKRKDKEGALEKSRKRRATEDGQRGDGMGGTGLFEKRKKRMMSKLR